MKFWKMGVSLVGTRGFGGFLFLGKETRTWLGRDGGFACLEEHVHDEDLVALGAEGVEAVGEGGENADEDADHHDALEEGAQRSRGALAHRVAEEEHADAAAGAADALDDPCQ